ncbi:hypothetical protein [Limimaricola sp.]|nr:hypothetical protein [Limimaricola sp.]
MNRNLLYTIIGALAVVVAGLAYQSYRASQDKNGVQINVGKDGVSITGTK